MLLHITLLCRMELFYSIMDLALQLHNITRFYLKQRYYAIMVSRDRYFRGHYNVTLLCQTHPSFSKGSIGWALLATRIRNDFNSSYWILVTESVFSYCSNTTYLFTIYKPKFTIFHKQPKLVLSKVLAAKHFFLNIRLCENTFLISYKNDIWVNVSVNK